MQRVTLETPILKKNDEYAAENRARFESHGLAVFNMMSAPGAGKTTLLERTLGRFGAGLRCGVIEGDIQTSIDAERIRAVGIPAHQINTSCCHLDAKMIQDAMTQFAVEQLDALVIENVGNMVCPAAYDLGETCRVMVYSVPEGAEKPKKYPKMFHRSHCVVLNKIDLAPYTNVRVDELRRNVLDVSPHATVIALSCTSGEGLDEWVQWMRSRIEAVRGAPCV